MPRSKAPKGKQKSTNRKKKNKREGKMNLLQKIFGWKKSSKKIEAASEKKPQNFNLIQVPGGYKVAGNSDWGSKFLFHVVISTGELWCSIGEYGLHEIPFSKIGEWITLYEDWSGNLALHGFTFVRDERCENRVLVLKGRGYVAAGISTEDMAHIAKLLKEMKRLIDPILSAKEAQKLPPACTLPKRVTSKGYEY